jgi:nicotinate-nucleotide--dimethylbenzimidazole phosphoribosyltransferase
MPMSSRLVVVALDDEVEALRKDKADEIKTREAAERDVEEIQKRLDDATTDMEALADEKAALKRSKTAMMKDLEAAQKSLTTAQADQSARDASCGQLSKALDEARAKLGSTDGVDSVATRTKSGTRVLQHTAVSGNGTAHLAKAHAVPLAHKHASKRAAAAHTDGNATAGAVIHKGVQNETESEMEERMNVPAENAHVFGKKTSKKAVPLPLGDDAPAGVDADAKDAGKEAEEVAEEEEVANAYAADPSDSVAKGKGKVIAVAGDEPVDAGDALGGAQRFAGDPDGSESKPIANSKTGGDADPEAAEGDPDAAEGDPKAAAEDPEAVEGDPVAAEGDPVAAEGDPEAAEGDPEEVVPKVAAKSHAPASKEEDVAEGGEEEEGGAPKAGEEEEAEEQRSKGGVAGEEFAGATKKEGAADDVSIGKKGGADEGAAAEEEGATEVEEGAAAEGALEGGAAAEEEEEGAVAAEGEEAAVVAGAEEEEEAGGAAGGEEAGGAAGGEEAGAAGGEFEGGAV